MYFILKKTIVIVVFTIIIANSWVSTAYAEDLEMFTNSQVYTAGQPLFVYGNALSNENLIVRLFAPDGTIAKFDQLIVSEDGS